MNQRLPLAKRVAAEALGTAFLLAGVVGSGIMAQRLCGDNIGLALLANTLATGGVLMCLIASLGPISGAHFNPAVSVSDAIRGGLRWIDVAAYIPAQCLGALVGVATANAMFGLPLLFASHHARSGPAQWLGEFVATFGLLAIIWGCVRYKPALVPFSVASYIVGAYWFTSSTSFANPAVTLARSFSDTFAGIRPIDAPAFIIVEMLGALSATVLFSWLAPREAPHAA